MRSASPSAWCNNEGCDDASYPLHNHEVGKEVTGLMENFSLMFLEQIRTVF